MGAICDLVYETVGAALLHSGGGRPGPGSDRGALDMVPIYTSTSNTHIFLTTPATDSPLSPVSS